MHEKFKEMEIIISLPKRLKNLTADDLIAYASTGITYFTVSLLPGCLSRLVYSMSHEGRDTILVNVVSQTKSTVSRPQEVHNKYLKKHMNITYLCSF